MVNFLQNTNNWHPVAQPHLTHWLQEDFNEILD